MKTIFTFLLLIFLSVKSFAQAPAKQWQKPLGGGSEDYATCIKQTTEGGYIMAAITSSNNGNVSGNHGLNDIWIVKLNSSAGIVWKKCYGGTSGETVKSILQTTDGGYIFVGTTTSNDGDVSGNHTNNTLDIWVVKINSLGVIEWKKCLGGTFADYANSIQQTTDGGYIIAGNTLSNDGDVSGNHGNMDCWVVKLNNSGTIEWQNCYGGLSTDYANSIQQTSDGGYILCGYSKSNDIFITDNHGNYDALIIKINATGTVQWQKSYGGNNIEYGNSILQTTDGGYILSGTTKSINGDFYVNHGNYDFCVVKLSNTGTMEWQKLLGGTNDDECVDILQTTDGNFIAAGFTTSNTGDGDVNGQHGLLGYSDFWIIKLNTSGTKIWQKCLGGSYNDYAYSIIQTSDQGFVVVGYIESSDGDISGDYTGSDAWVVKLAPETLSTEEINTPNKAQIYPNPTSDFINLKSEENIQSISIIDITGKQVFSTTKNTEKIDISALQKGMYLLKITTQNGITQTEKIIKN